MKEFEFEYDNFTFKLSIPSYWDTIYAGKPREPLYHDYCLMLGALKGADKEKYVLDIGANHGLFSVPAAKLGYKVFGFEPVAENIESLELAKQSNNLSHFDMFHLALSNCNTTTQIYIPECPDNASLSKDAAVSNMIRKGYVMEMVNTYRFDDWIKDNPDYMDIGFIKMDVQGSEYSILEGMKEYLEGANDIFVVCEYEHHLNTMGHTFQQLDDLFLSYGFLFISQLTPSDKLFFKP